MLAGSFEFRRGAATQFALLQHQMRAFGGQLPAQLTDLSDRR